MTKPKEPGKPDELPPEVEIGKPPEKPDAEPQSGGQPPPPVPPPPR